MPQDGQGSEYDPWRHKGHGKGSRDSWHGQEDSNPRTRFWRPPLYQLSYTHMRRPPQYGSHGPAVQLGTGDVFVPETWAVPASSSQDYLLAVPTALSDWPLTGRLAEHVESRHPELQEHRGIGPLAERVGFEPTRASALSVFETDALGRAVRPLLIYIYYMQLRQFIFYSWPIRGHLF